MPMRTARGMWVLLCAMAAVSALAAPLGAPHGEPLEPRVVTLAADPFCPYNCSPDAQKPGFAVELAQAAFKTAEMRVDYITAPWPRAITEARLGRADGVIAALVEDAPDFTFPSTAIGVQAMGFLIRRGDPWRFEGLDSLRDRRVGLIDRYSYGAEADAFFAKGEGLRFERIAGEGGLALNIEKLARDRLDVVVDDRAVLRWAMVDAGAASLAFEVAPGALIEAPVFIAFTPSRRGRVLAAAFDRGMALIEESGEAATIRSRYGLAN